MSHMYFFGEQSSGSLCCLGALLVVLSVFVSVCVCVYVFMKCTCHIWNRKVKTMLLLSAKKYKHPSSLDILHAHAESE